MTQILIDATGLDDASAFRGIGTYLRHLLAGLSIQPELMVTALTLDGRRVDDAVAAGRVRRRAPGRFRAAEHELLLPFDLRRHPAAVFHSPALTPPWRCRPPWVQTLHDVIPLVFDDPGLASERRRFLRLGRRIASADAVIAVSRHTADTGIAMLGLDPRRVEVIPHGVDPSFAPDAHAPPRSGDDAYLLFVGEYSARKGYPEAFEVAGRLAEAGHPHHLQVTGRIAPWLEPTVRRLVAESPRPERISLLGYVDDLAAAYRGATALLMTSRYEGFGFPALEAMACGTPVIAFANSALPEVVGDAGILVPDGDVAAMSAAAGRLLADAEYRDELVARGLRRAATFSWERSVRSHVEIYRSLVR